MTPRPVMFEMSPHQGLTVITRLLQGETDDAISKGFLQLSGEQALEAFAALVAVQRILPKVGQALTWMLQHHGYSMQNIYIGVEDETPDVHPDSAMN